MRVTSCLDCYNLLLLYMEMAQDILWALAGQLIELELRWILVELRGHVTDDSKQFLISTSSHWLASCRAK